MTGLVKPPLCGPVAGEQRSLVQPGVSDRTDYDGSATTMIDLGAKATPSSFFGGSNAMQGNRRLSIDCARNACFLRRIPRPRLEFLGSSRHRFGSCHSRFDL